MPEIGLLPLIIDSTGDKLTPRKVSIRYPPVSSVSYLYTRPIRVLVAGLILLKLTQDVCYGVITLLGWNNLVDSEVLWTTGVTPLEAQF